MILRRSDYFSTSNTCWKCFWCLLYLLKKNWNNSFPNIYLCKFFRFRFSYGDPFGMTSFCILNQSETSLDVIELSGGTHTEQRCLAAAAAAAAWWCWQKVMTYCCVPSWLGMDFAILTPSSSSYVCTYILELGTARQMGNKHASKNTDIYPQLKSILYLYSLFLSYLWWNYF